MPTTFFFDLFGVLLGADKSSLIHYIAKKTDSTYEFSNTVFDKQFSKFEKRQINFSQFFQNLQYELNNGENLEVEEFKSVWMQQDLAELPTVKYIPQLKEQYSVNLISNVSNSYLSVLQNKFDFFKSFDNFITSESANSAKPSPQIFNFALNKLGVLPNESIFIDDQMQNVSAAKKIGITVFQYKDFNEFKKFIANYIKMEDE